MAEGQRKPREALTLHAKTLSILQRGPDMVSVA